MIVLLPIARRGKQTGRDGWQAEHAVPMITSHGNAVGNRRLRVVVDIVSAGDVEIRLELLNRLIDLKAVFPIHVTVHLAGHQDELDSGMGRFRRRGAETAYQSGFRSPASRALCLDGVAVSGRRPKTVDPELMREIGLGVHWGP